jgi:hypothetical protein
MNGAMSAIGNKADITIVLNHVCFGGKADIEQSSENVRF